MKCSGQFIFRMREFEQMEMQFCSSWMMKHYEFWKEARLKWHLSLGLGKKITVFTIMRN
jgi:glycyl-tRNA synthetase